ncbi:hypothetical protein BCR37DRAFT_382584 [Protomyces lactucae-debilis]|uniref:Uncharacterized protein n=1 Tax=Protomyces lactucae-debilis TaxID=2754530 RepID=A0A1Y2F422_PROLT|nr:uncharacterized protein BCR37DRAFT_382584 [Protomyces lactucae-debilis]ORY77695.1 hypothetical protein BCR37DRAFT_382584 [Protomyces lactucae-debilis]
MSSELSLLTLQSIDANDQTRSCIQCDYNAVFDTRLAKTLLCDTSKSESLKAFLSSLSEKITEALHQSKELSSISVLELGVSFLNAFLQLNYTGPSFPTHKLLPDHLTADKERLHDEVLDLLTVDGERPYALVQAPLYLLLASHILHHQELTDCVFVSWFRMRVDFVHQRLLDDTVSTLHNRIFDIEKMEAIENAIASVQVVSGSQLEARWHLELAHIYSHYSYDQKALAQVKLAQRSSRIVMQVSGALGRRTKYQTFDVSQLVVLAQSSSDTVAAAQHHKSARPAQLDLNDDTLLESVSFTKQPQRKTEHENLPEIVRDSQLPPVLAALDPGNQPLLSTIDQCILIAYAGVIKLSAASDDKIVMEQVAAYVNRVLHSPSTEQMKDGSHLDWTTHTAALLARTRIEGHRSRTVERSVLQLQVLVDQLLEDIDEGSAGNASAARQLPEHVGHEAAPVDSSKAKVSFLQRADRKASASGAERLRHLFTLPMSSRFDLEAELAGKYTSIGLVRSALEIFTRIENWEAVAMCYGVMEQEGKAEAVLREQIESNKPGRNIPKLWCLLGDVVQSLEYWEKSWQVSGERYARAQRSIGKYHFARKEHDLAIKAYSLSLKINPLNHGAWFIYGCSGLETGQYELAAEAFTRCVSIEQQDGESWNNLASALLRVAPSATSNRRRDAWTALKMATQIKHESWRMWENYMLVSLDVGEFGECIHAMRRCIELRSNDRGEAAVDFEVLKLLVQETIQMEPPTSATSESGHSPDALRGVARMVTDLVTQVVQPLITYDPRLWRLLGKLQIWRGKFAEALEANEKAYRCLAGKMVETEYKVFEEVVDAADELVDAYRNLGPREGRMGGEVARDWKFKARSVVRTLKGRGKNFEGSAAYEKLENILEDLKSA